MANNVIQFPKIERKPGNPNVRDAEIIVLKMKVKQSSFSDAIWDFLHRSNTILIDHKEEE